MTVGPVFLLASERSGTNLLRRRLTDAQQDLFGPAPIQILKVLYDVAPYYGNPADADVFRALIHDSLRLCYDHFSPWDIRFEVDDIEAAHQRLFRESRSVVSLMHTLFNHYARAKGFTSYFCKDNNLFDYGVHILREIPDAGFVYLHRDPRDCVASQLARPTQTSSTVRLAELWRDEQLKCIAFLDQVSGIDVFRLSYESFIADEDSALASICRHFGLSAGETSANMAASDRTDIHEWKNLQRETLQGNAERYRQKLSKSQVATVEGIVWPQMRWLGYDPDNVERPVVGRLRRVWDRELHIVLDIFRRRLAKGKITAGQRLMEEAVGAIRQRGL